MFLILWWLWVVVRVLDGQATRTVPEAAEDVVLVSGTAPGAPAPMSPSPPLPLPEVKVELGLPDVPPERTELPDGAAAAASVDHTAQSAQFVLRQATTTLLAHNGFEGGALGPWSAVTEPQT